MSAQDVVIAETEAVETNDSLCDEIPKGYATFLEWWLYGDGDYPQGSD